MKSNNQINVLQAKAAQEVGITLQSGDNGHLPHRPGPL